MESKEKAVKGLNAFGAAGPVVVEAAVDAEPPGKLCLPVNDDWPLPGGGEGRSPKKSSLDGLPLKLWLGNAAIDVDVLGGL